MKGCETKLSEGGIRNVATSRQSATTYSKGYPHCTALGSSPRMEIIGGSGGVMREIPGPGGGPGGGPRHTRAWAGRGIAARGDKEVRAD